MSITLTFFKRKGDKQSDIFRGTSDGPGAQQSQWELISRDKDMKEAGIKFLVIEYVKESDLPEGYDRKVKRSPYLDLRYKDDVRNSVTYPGRSPLSLVNVKSWALEVVESFSYKAENPTPKIEEQIEKIVDDKMKTSGNTTVIVEKPRSSWVAPTIIATSFLAVGLAAVVGSGFDKKVNKWARYAILDDSQGDPYDNKLYDTKGNEVSTPEVKWEIIDEETEALLLPKDDDFM